KRPSEHAYGNVYGSHLGRTGLFLRLGDLHQLSSRPSIFHNANPSLGIHGRRASSAYCSLPDFETLDTKRFQLGWYCYVPSCSFRILWVCAVFRLHCATSFIGCSIIYTRRNGEISEPRLVCRWQFCHWVGRLVVRSLPVALAADRDSYLCFRPGQVAA